MGIGERPLQAQVDTIRAQLAGQPAHQVRRIGGEEVIARRGQQHVAQVRRIQAHVGDALHQMLGHAPQPGLLHRFFHHDAGGVQALAGVGLAFKHADAQTVLGGSQCAGGTGEAGADDDHVVVVGGRSLGHCDIAVGSGDAASNCRVVRRRSGGEVRMKRGTRKRKTLPCGSVSLESGAGNETRTRDLNLGKVALYQLSYSRLGGEILPIPRMASSAFFRVCEASCTAYPRMAWIYYSVSAN